MKTETSRSTLLIGTD